MQCRAQSKSPMRVSTGVGKSLPAVTERYGSRWVGGHRGWWGLWQNRELPSYLKASMCKKLKNTCSPNVSMSRDLVLSQLECPISDGCLSLV